MKVVIVDDAAMVRRIIARAPRRIEGVDVEVIEALDGRHALSIPREHGSSFDLILCDIKTPMVSGLAVLRTPSTSPELGSIPCIAVTAHGSGAFTEQDVRTAWPASFSSRSTKARSRRSVGSGRGTACLSPLADPARTPQHGLSCRGVPAIGGKASGRPRPGSCQANGGRLSRAKR